MNKTPSQSLFFVALIPPLPIQTYAADLTQMLGDRYQMRASKSPPHITLYAPFQWPIEQLSVLDGALQVFAPNAPPVPIHLAGFGAFPPRVLYVHVEKTPELLNLQAQLLDHLEATLGLVDLVARRRPYTPHLTLASKNVAKRTFAPAWEDLQPHAAEFEFEGDRLTLLHHRGDRWHVQADYPLVGPSLSFVMNP